MKEEYWCSECNRYVGGIKPTSLAEAKCPVCGTTGLRLFSDEGPRSWERMHENLLQTEIEIIEKTILKKAAQIISDSEKSSWKLSEAQDKQIEELRKRSNVYQIKYGTEFYHILEIPTIWDYAKLCNIDLDKTSQSQFNDLVNCYIEDGKTYLAIVRNSILARTISFIFFLLFFFYLVIQERMSGSSIYFNLGYGIFTIFFIKPQIILSLMGRRKFIRN